MAKSYRKAGTRLMTGVEELDKKLAELKTGAANKIARPVLSKGARVLLKKMKAGVPPDKKSAKRALGMVVDTKGGKSRNQQRAKVGASVGKASKAEAKRSGKNSGGVGISGQNIHWSILGTKKRATSSGKNTGSMPPILPDLVKNATTAAKSEMLSEMVAEGQKRLAQLAAK